MSTRNVWDGKRDVIHGLRTQGVKPKVQDVLQFADGGPSVDAARKAMIEAGEVPRGLAKNPTETAAVASATPIEPDGAADALEPEFAETDEVTVASNPNADAQAEELRLQNVPVPPAKPKPPTPANAPVRVTELQPERVETDKFVAEIREEKGQWVAEIQYKNGAGTEKFTARSKGDLMLELLRGKGNATLRVREAVRREKLGGPKLDKAYPLPAGMTTEAFEKLPEETQGQIIETVAAGQAMAWREQTPEYYKTKANGETLDNFLRENNLPWTVSNLRYAFEELTENDLFPDKRGIEAVVPVTPTPATTILAQPDPKPAAEDSATVETVAAAPASPASAAPAQPVVVVRRRGSTGLQPGSSSASPAPPAPEDGSQPKEPSEAELRKMPIDQLKRIANDDRRRRAATR